MKLAEVRRVGVYAVAEAIISFILVSSLGQTCNFNGHFFEYLSTTTLQLIGGVKFDVHTGSSNSIYELLFMC